MKWLCILMTSLTLAAQSAQAQFLDSGDDSYDPFVDYSEFEDAAAEEADINFFRHGRFVTMGFGVGMRSFTGNLGQIYSSNANYGLFLSYFFDMRFALQFGYVTGEHRANFPLDEPVIGNVSLSRTYFNLKYYMNPQNMTRGLGALNPYIIGGISNHNRVYTLQGFDGFSSDAATGFDIGGGIEVPLMRNKMFLGIQGLYQVVTFKDENVEFRRPGDAEGSGVFPSGDMIEFKTILGVNF